MASNNPIDSSIKIDFETEMNNIGTTDQSEQSKTENNCQNKDSLTTLNFMLKSIEENSPSSIELSVCIFNIHLENENTCHDILKNFEERILKVIVNYAILEVKRNLLLFLSSMVKKSKIENPENFPIILVEEMYDLIGNISIDIKSPFSHEKLVYLADLLGFFALFEICEPNNFKILIGDKGSQLFSILTKFYSNVLTIYPNSSDYFYGKMIEFSDSLTEEANKISLNQSFQQNISDLFEFTFLHLLDTDKFFQITLIFVNLINCEISLKFLHPTLISFFCETGFRSIFSKTSLLKSYNTSLFSNNTFEFNEENQEAQINQLLRIKKCYFYGMIKIFEGPFLELLILHIESERIFSTFTDFCELLRINEQVLDFLLKLESENAVSLLKKYLRSLSLGFLGFSNCLQVFQSKKSLNDESVYFLLELAFSESKRVLIACTTLKSDAVIFENGRSLLDNQLKSVNLLIEFETCVSNEILRNKLVNIFQLEEIVNIFDFLVLNFDIFEEEIVLELIEVLVFTVNITKKNKLYSGLINDAVVKVF